MISSSADSSSADSSPADSSPEDSSPEDSSSKEGEGEGVGVGLRVPYRFQHLFSFFKGDASRGLIPVAFIDFLTLR